MKKTAWLFAMILFFAAIGATHAQFSKNVSLKKAIEQTANEIIKAADFDKNPASKIKPAVAVINIDSPYPYPRLKQYILDELINALVNSKTFEIVERTRVDAIVNENIFHASDPVVSFVITGGLFHDGLAWRLTVYVIDLKRKTRVFSATRSIKTNDPQITYLRGGTNMAPSVNALPSAPTR
jgi:hypothetical protein